MKLIDSDNLIRDMVNLEEDMRDVPNSNHILSEVIQHIKAEPCIETKNYDDEAYWIVTEYEDVDRHIIITNCSNCHKGVLGIHTTNYCPHCGTRMNMEKTEYEEE